MRKILYSVVLAVCGALSFTGCSNDDETGAENVRNYQANFEKLFGEVNPSQNFNTQRTVTIDASMEREEVKGNYTLKVYDGMPGSEGTSLLGKFKNLSAADVSTVKVGVSKGVKELFFMSDDGKTRLLTASEVPSSGRVNATFDIYTGTAPALKTADEPTSVTIAFEDLGAEWDYDFNDVVIRVDYVTGTGTATVTLMAVASTLPMKLYYAPADGAKQALFDGKELHSVMGYAYTNTVINANWKTAFPVNGVDYVPFQACEISVPEDFVIGEDGVPFILEVNGKEGQIKITSSTEYGATPQVLVVGKYKAYGRTYYYRWPKDRVRLNLAFPQVGTWMSNPDNLSFLSGCVIPYLYDGYDQNTGEELSYEYGEAPAGVEAVDLGLPSGTKWANMNVGATTPEEFGNYYAWGEIAEKEVYNLLTYTFYSGYYVSGWGGNSHPQCDFLGINISGTVYDVATMSWGPEWQMPTKEQIDELLTYATYKYIRQNGLNGCTFSNNGKSIFLPAAGSPSYTYSGPNSDTYWDGNYWSSSRIYASTGGCEAWALLFSSAHRPRDPEISNFDRGSRPNGFSVRPVLRN